MNHFPSGIATDSVSTWRVALGSSGKMFPNIAKVFAPNAGVRPRVVPAPPPCGAHRGSFLPPCDYLLTAATRWGVTGGALFSQALRM